MATTRIYSLANEAAPDDNDYLVIDNPTFVAPKNTTKAQFMSDEATARASMDNAIIAGAGLEPDGSLVSIPASAYLKNADFAAAGYTIDLKNGLALLDTAINNYATSGDLEIGFSFTSAEILALGTAIIKMPAPTLGTFYDVQSIFFRNNVNTPYTVGAGGITIRYTSGKTISTITQAMVQAASTIRYHIADITHEVVLNDSIEFVASGGNPAAGNGTFDFIIRYKMRQDFIMTPMTVPSSCCVFPISDTFVNADLDGAGNLVITHNQATTDVYVVVMNNLGVSVATTFSLGDALGANTTNQITIPIGLGIVGTYSYFLMCKIV